LRQRICQTGYAMLDLQNYAFRFAQPYGFHSVQSSPRGEGTNTSPIYVRAIRITIKVVAFLIEKVRKLEG
jgi:hypothetical protein